VNRWIYGLVVALPVLLASCVGEPDAVPGPPSVTRVSPTSPPWWIPSSPPPIPRPLDASAYREKPCDLFTDDQAKSLGYVRTSDPFVQEEVSRCSRSGEGAFKDNSLLILYFHDTDRLGQIHRREAEWPSDGAVPRTILGQPAVSAVIGGNWCWLVVGLTETQSVEIRIEDHVPDNRSNTCDRAMSAAEGIVRKLV
jgi:hypothetical protein